MLSRHKEGDPDEFLLGRGTKKDSISRKNRSAIQEKSGNMKSLYHVANLTEEQKARRKAYLRTRGDR